jgi:hypothetical protein
LFVPLPQAGCGIRVIPVSKIRILDIFFFTILFMRIRMKKIRNIRVT